MPALDGLRILDMTQWEAGTSCTQALAWLGADVVKIEAPGVGDPARYTQGAEYGSYFCNWNANKRSVTLDLKSPDGIEIFLELAKKFDVVAENFKAGTADRLGIGYEAVSTVHPGVVYLSVSGFGNDPASPYIHRAAYASIVEGMSGIYEFKRKPGKPPAANPVGALGDISSALFGVVGILAALRQRDLTGLGQRIDIAMLDATMAMTDIVANFYSLGIPDEFTSGVGIVETFAAGEGHFVLQVVREHHFEKLAALTGNPQWLAQDGLADRAGWMAQFESVIRPGVEAWAADKTNREAVQLLSAEGIAAGESNSSEEIVNDDHVVARNQLVAMERPDPSEGPPVLAPGNPIRMTRLGIGPETRVPWLGEHTDEVLAAELGFDEERLTQLRASGVTA